MTFRAIAEENLRARIGGNPYPGRGIVLGLNASGSHYIQVYWTMGRSANSRNRTITVESGDVKLAPYVPDPQQDPRLIMYTAMTSVGDAHIVSNGDQTLTIAQGLRKGEPFESALLTRSHEPDAPHFTSRISGMIDLGGRSLAKASRIVADPTDQSRSVHCLYDYHGFEPGFGVCLHTYRGDGSPLPSFDADPFVVVLDDAPPVIAERYWNLLSAENRVALAVKAIDRTSGGVTIELHSRHLPRL